MIVSVSEYELVIVCESECVWVIVSELLGVSEWVWENVSDRGCEWERVSVSLNEYEWVSVWVWVSVRVSLSDC